MHDVGLLVELVAIDVLDAETYIIIKIKSRSLAREKNTTDPLPGLAASLPVQLCSGTQRPQVSSYAPSSDYPLDNFLSHPRPLRVPRACGKKLAVVGRLTGFSCLLDVESVSHVEKVRVDEAESLGNVGLHLGFGVEDELDPALVPLMSNVVLQWSSDLALAYKGTVDKSVEYGRLNPRHLSSSKFIITAQT
jgi:hypothetical protein